MASTCTEPLMDGLENYEVGELIGQGSFSTVNLAVCKRGRMKGRRVVLKTIPKLLVVDDQAYRIAVETHRSLHHPAVLSLFSAFETPYAFYEVLEYCSRGSLAEYFPSPGPMSKNAHIQKLDSSQLRGVVRNLIEGVIYIHRNQILHLDLRPSNIYISKDNRMKIGGFYFARPIGGAVNTFPFKEVDRDTFQNRLSFAAPEVLQGRPCGPAADAWSLGCICTTLTSGRYLEPGGIVGNLTKSLPCEVRDLIKGLLQENPQARVSLHEIMVDSFLDPTLPIKSIETLRRISKTTIRDEKHLSQPPESRRHSFNLDFASENAPHDHTMSNPSHPVSRISPANSVLFSRPGNVHDCIDIGLQLRSYSAPPGLPKSTTRKPPTRAYFRQISTPELVPKADVRIPLLRAGVLQPSTFRTVHGMITLQKSGSIIVDLREGERLKGHKGDTILCVKSDGGQVEVHRAPHLSLPCSLKEPVAILEIDKLPQRLKGMYTFARKYLDGVKRRTPMLVINFGNAKFSMMSNTPQPDVELLVAEPSSYEDISNGMDFTTRVRISRQDRTLEIARYRQGRMGSSITGLLQSAAPRTGEWIKMIMPLLNDGSIDFFQIEDKESVLLKDYIKICELLETTFPIPSRSLLMEELCAKLRGQSSLLPPISVKVDDAHLTYPSPKTKTKHIVQDSEPDLPRNRQHRSEISEPDIKPQRLKPRLAGLGLPPRPSRLSLSHHEAPVGAIRKQMPRSVHWNAVVDERTGNLTGSRERVVERSTSLKRPKYFEDIGWLVDCSQSKVEWLLLDGERLAIDDQKTVSIQSKSDTLKFHGPSEDAMNSPILSQAAKTAILMGTKSLV